MKVICPPLSLSRTTVPYGNRGCSGGSRLSSIMYAVDNGGLDTSSSYPYIQRVCTYLAAD